MTSFPQFNQSPYELNAQFWIEVVRERLDKYQTELTDIALENMMGDLQGLDVLDAGCGEGYLTRKLLTQNPKRLVGIDNSPTLLSAAKSLAGDNGDNNEWNIEYYLAGVEDIPINDQSMDVIIANRLPHNENNPEKRFYEFARILRPRGKLILLTHHPVFYDNHPDKQQRILPASDEYFQQRIVEKITTIGNLSTQYPSRIPLYSLEAHFSFLTNAGFAITQLKEPHPKITEIVNDAMWKDFYPIFLLIEAIKLN